jgi:hypothetical protein
MESQHCQFRNTKKSRWYIGTNIVAMIIQCVSISTVTKARLHDLQSYLYLAISLLWLSQLLILMLIRQNLMILKFFAFLNDYRCQQVEKYATIFLYIEYAVSFATLFVRTYYYATDNEEGLNATAKLIYNYNSSVVGLFLVMQTSIQNLWISYKVYNVAKKTKSKIVTSNYVNLLYILLSVTMNDM